MPDPTDRNDATARPWWCGSVRIYQPNLRLIDGAQRAADLVQQARDLSANAMVLNAGGAFAFYPTALDSQVVVPTLAGDLFGDTVREARRHGIRVIARIEASVKPQAVYARHPEWCYADADGRPLDARGHWSTCINGPGFRAQLRAIVDELMDRCMPDGVFFNGYGYRESDAAGYRGPCRCAGCAAAFRAFAGTDLPSAAGWRDGTDPTCDPYRRFKTVSVAAFFREVRDHAHARNPAAVVYHGTHYTPLDDRPGHAAGQELAPFGDAPDVIRCEYQQMPFHRPATWHYWPGEQGKIGLVAGHRTDIIVDYPISGHYRHGCHARGWVGLALARTLASMAIPHLHFIGTMGDQEDRQGISVAKDLFRLAAENERAWDGAEPASPVGLFLSDGTLADDPAGRSLAAYRGWYRALARGHVPFDVLPSPAVGPFDFRATLARFGAVILPDVRVLSDTEREALDAYVDDGGTIVATLGVGDGASRGALSLACLREIALESRIDADMNAYFRLGAERVPGMPDDIDIVPVHGEVWHAMPLSGAESRLRFVPPQANRIPEDAYIDIVTDWPGLVALGHGRGRAVWLPWAPDAMFHAARQPAIERLLLGALDLASPAARGYLATDAPPAVEMTLARASGRLYLHLVNGSGCQDGAFDDPLPIGPIRVSIEGRFEGARALAAGVDLPVERDEDRVAFTIPRLELYEVVELDPGAIESTA